MLSLIAYGFIGVVCVLSVAAIIDSVARDL